MLDLSHLLVVDVTQEFISIIYSVIMQRSDVISVMLCCVQHLYASHVTDI